MSQFPIQQNCAVLYFRSHRHKIHTTNPAALLFHKNARKIPLTLRRKKPTLFYFSGFQPLLIIFFLSTEKIHPPVSALSLSSSAMSSLFRARRPEEPRSGGKMLRGWRATPSASPYARPPAGLPAAGQSGSPRWLSGLISGAGKLISSVLPSYRSSESPSSASSAYSSDEEETSSGFNENEEELQRSNQEGNESEFVNQCMNGQLAVVPKSEAKLAIEQLLMQERFSREECDKLTKLIQSRVVDFPSPEVCGNGIEELRSRTTGNGTLPGALLSFSQKRTLSERVPYSSSKMNGFSHRPFLFEACTPDICNKAVSEAKKWLEEKKLASKPKYDSECGPCTLNTDMLQYGIESEAGSPVDMAKTYMRSLPPWKSPSFSGVGFKTPPPSGMRRYKDGTSYENSDNSLTLSKGLKRGHLFIESWDTLDETRRVRLKSIDDKLEIAKSKAIESSARLSERESSKSLSDPDKRGNICSLNILPQQEEIIEAVHSAPAISVPSTHPQEPTQSLDENQPSQTIEKVDNVSVPHDTLAPASRLMEHDGNPASEIKVMPRENIKLAVPKETSSGVERTALSDSSSQLNPVSGIAERNCISDSRTEDGNPHISKKTNGSINELSANGSSSEVNANSNHETLSKGTDTIMPQNGTKKKSIERVLTEPQPQATTSRRGRKMVVKSRRGRKS